MDDLGQHHENLKILEKIPIYIVEDHHDVVPFIHQNIRKRYLPLYGNTLIHLDSHPDMLIPKKMPADDAYDSAVLYKTHAIENWIMPNCYTGIFQHLIWVKPPWAKQMKDSHQKIYIGKCKSTSTMRLECRENYFISEELFMLRKDMESIREITLDCMTLGNRLNGAEEDLERVKQLSETNLNTPTILDIDLDFFSTQNPFSNYHAKANLYDRLKRIFRFNPPKSDSDVDILASQQERTAQMAELEMIFDHLLELDCMPVLDGEEPSARYTEVVSMVEALLKHYTLRNVDWDIIFNAGCTIDDNGLPEHISTAEELDVLYKSFEDFLDTLLEAPRFITISRSSDDDYTPKSQVSKIQKKVLEILNSKYVCDAPIISNEMHVPGDEYIPDL